MSIEIKLVRSCQINQINITDLQLDAISTKVVFTYDNIQLLPLSEGDMTICSPEGEQIVMSPSLKDNNCFNIPNHF